MGAVMQPLSGVFKKAINFQAVLNQNDNTLNESDIRIDKDTFIIGSGWGRTGTSSLQRALNILGYNCYHMREALKNDDVDTFIEIGTEKMKLKNKNISNGINQAWNNTLIEYKDWNKVFKDRNYSACVDAPCCAFYKELMQFYPNYKVIHSMRDSEKWYNSAIETTMAGFLLVKNRWFMSLLFNKLREMWQICIHGYLFDDKLNDKQFVKKRYEEWNEEVINYVPKDRLLLFDVKKHGWKELCQFLEIKHEPNQPFPHSNERKIIKNVIKSANIICDAVDAASKLVTIAIALLIIMYTK